jgi:hypothetical protein
VGTLAFRVNLASALQAAGATALMAILCHEVLLGYFGSSARRQPGWILPAASSLAALFFGLSYSLWFQAVRAEVYALNALLVVGGVAFTLRWHRTGDRRFLLAAALFAGLGLCNHHFLVLLTLPPILLFLVLRVRRVGVGRLVVGLLLAGALGLSTLAYIPLRARQAPVVNWGMATTTERLAWVISAEAFHQSLDKAAQETVQHRAIGGVFSLVRGMVWESALALLAGFAAIAGFYLLWRRRETWKVGLLLTTLVACNLASPMVVGLDPLNPDAYGYLCIGVAGLCPGLAVVAAALISVVVLGVGGGRRWSVGLVSLLALVPIYQVIVNLRAVDLRGHWAAEETGRQVLLQQPPGALLFTSYFETIFNTWALQVTSDLRPDLQVVHRNFISQKGYLEQLAARQPQLAPLAKRWKQAGHLLAGDLEQLASGRSVRLEVDLNLHREVTTRLAPAGLAQAFGIPRTLEGASRHRELIDRWERAAGVNARGGIDLETRRAVVWTHYLLSLFACQQNLKQMARFHHARAERLAPFDRRLSRLAVRCRLDPDQTD